MKARPSTPQKGSPGELLYHYTTPFEGLFDVFERLQVVDITDELGPNLHLLQPFETNLIRGFVEGLLTRSRPKFYAVAFDHFGLPQV